MAENTILNSMSGGDTIQTEDVGASKIQRMKIALGAKDVDALQDVTNVTPFPVIITNTTVSGTRTTVSGTQHVSVDNIPTYQGVRLYDANGKFLGIAANPLEINLNVGGTPLNQSGGNLLVNVQNFGVGQFSAQDGNANNTTSALVMNQPELLNTSGNWDRWRGDSTNGARVQIPAGTTVSGLATPTPSLNAASLSLFRNVTISGSAIAVKASAGKIYKGHFYNPNAVTTFLNFYNLAQGSVTFNVTAPTWSWEVPAGGAFDMDSTIPMPATTAITITASNTISGTGNPTKPIAVEMAYM